MSNRTTVGATDAAGEQPAARPPIVDLAAWEASREDLLARERAHTRASDEIAAARRRMPMLELDGSVSITGADGPVAFLDLFQGRNELVIYKSMWYDDTPHQGQCEGCTQNVWNMKDTYPYLNARGVSSAFLTPGPWDEVEPFVAFMGYTQPWFSVRDTPGLIGDDSGPVGTGHIACFLRDETRVFLTYSTTGRGNEPADASLGLLDMTVYGRGEAWQDDPEGWPAFPSAGAPIGGHGAPICWYWRTDADGVATWGPTSRPTPQWTRPHAGHVTTLGRRSDPH